MEYNSTKHSPKQSIHNRSVSRRDFISTGLKAGAAAFTTSLLPNLNVSAKGRYNVLLIMVDDLRPLLGCYGHTEMHTPNIDRLAARGTVFNRAYCQYPLCSPSRTTIMTGLRPDTTQVTDNQVFFRETTPDVVTLPQHFKTYGYHTQSIGKVAHIPKFQDDVFSWSVPSWRPLWTSYDFANTPSWQALDVEDSVPRDGQTADRAIRVLKELKDQQFFISVGFYKPHLPYHAPRKYFELYEDITLNVPALSEYIQNTFNPPHWNAIRKFNDVPSGTVPIPYNKIIELARAYAAVTSYTDAQIGLVLDQLDALGLTDNTVIAFCGDHGYNLAENGNWGKNIIYEASLHSPMVVSMPGQNSVGESTDALVEFVDIFPTLCDSCCIPILPELEGISLLPVMDQPTLPWKSAAFSQYKMSRSIRTDKYRYTESPTEKELYDYTTDPYSDENVAKYPENDGLLDYLSKRLRSGWENALPESDYILPSPCFMQWDINNDGIIDIQDLLIISDGFGKTPIDNPKIDVNNDGSVDIIDLLIVAAHIGESAIASGPTIQSVDAADILSVINKWLVDARQVDQSNNTLRKGIEVLEAFTNTVIPFKTDLFPNYPNPFNPETWIPYDLAHDSNVNFTIYNLKGEIIWELDLGFKNAGSYKTKEQAAYWDGRNSHGDLVASGVYFYSLQTQHKNVTRKMVIMK